jgi:glycosyltransferase involved in cell wall biosynthesis
VNSINPKCSIVIRCYNEAAHIGKLLYGILQQTLNNVEIIVVDSGSTDGTLRIAKQYPVKAVEIKPEAFSFGRALNAGCSVSSGEFILIASAHVYPIYSDWIEKMLSHFKNPSIVLAYGKQIGGKKTHFSEHQIFAKWFPDVTNTMQEHPFCNNANCAIRRAIWEKQKYDEDLMGLEDIDWARRAMRKGYHVAYDAGAVVAHIHNEKSIQTFNRYRREAIALKSIYPNETFTFVAFSKLLISNIFQDYQKAIEAKVLRRNGVDIVRFRLMQFWGTYKGFMQADHLSQKLIKKMYYPGTNNHISPYNPDSGRNGQTIDYKGQG